MSEKKKVEMTFDEMLVAYEKVIDKNPSDLEYALWFTLKAFRSEIKELYERDITYFHKAFRQVNVVTLPYIDSVLWHLLSASEMFWEVINPEK